MLSPHAEASWLLGPAKGTPALPSYTKLRQADNMHDIMLLEYQPELGNAVRYLSATAMAASIGYVPSADTLGWYGYSDTTQPKYQLSTTKMTRLFCTGASYPLRDSGEAFWAPETPVHQVVARIAAKHRMSSTTAVSSRPAPPGPHGETWWEYLVRCADYVGWVVRPNATDLEFMPRTIDTVAPLIYSYDPRSASTNHTLLRFQAVQGETSPGSRRTTTALGVDDFGNLISLVDSSNVGVVTPALSGTYVEHVVTDFASAQAELLAERERTKMDNFAELSVQGNPKLRPGRTLLLRDLDDASDGYWYVSQVDHIVTLGGTYTCDCLIRRIGSGDPDPSYTPPARSTWYAPGDKTPTAAPPTVLAANVGPLPLASVQLGRWVAQSPRARTV